jgi:MoaA/NifB/PqqE/SkfB family radical SAM enzyme
MKFSDIPFDKCVRVGNKHYLRDNWFSVNWLLGRYCNYSCSYCWSYAHSKEKDYRHIDVIVKTLDSIFEQAKKRGYDKFSFSFSGGEPTFHPNFLDIVKHIKTQPISKINLTTNCSRDKKWWKELIPYLKDFSVTTSFHPEFTQRKPFLEKIKFLKENGARAQINIVLLEDRFDEMWDHAQYFYDQKVSVQAKVQIDYIDGGTFEKEYTPDQWDKIWNGLPRHSKKEYVFEMTDNEGNVYLVDNAERALGLRFNRFKGWLCDAGYRSMILTEPKGNIMRHYMCKEPPLGHINTGFKLYDEPRPCTTEICGSCADCKIPKYRSL